MKNEITVKQLKEKLKAEIKEIKKDLKPLTPEIQKKYDEYTDILKNLIELKEAGKLKPLDPETIKAHTGAAKIVHAHEKIKAFKETLNLDLVKAEKRYLITDVKQMISPAGSHYEELIFIAGKIAIHADTLENVPSSNVPLYTFDTHSV